MAASFRVAFVVCLLLAPIGAGSVERAPAVRVHIEAHANDAWLVEYHLARPAKRLVLGDALDGFRSRYWKVRSGGARLVEEDGRDVLVAKNGKPFGDLILDVAPLSEPLTKAYQAFTPMGAGGVLLYTGHFTPKTEDGGLIGTHFDIDAPKGAILSAFDETAPSFRDWTSPYDSPAFIYVGPDAPTETEAVSAIVDARAPAWVRAEAGRLVPALFSAYAGGLQRSLPTRPNLFIAVGDVSVEGQISFRGDALPGQFQATLEGGAWTTDKPEVRRTLYFTTAHEAAHLFQLIIDPGEDAPTFIHEGGADALAAEALVKIGLWTRADEVKELAAAKAECAALTESRSLLAAEADEVWRASYACGHVLTVAAAGAAGPAAFWARIMTEAEKSGAYDTALFVRVAHESAGEETANAIETFLRTNEARPDLALDRILALSGALS